MPDMSPGRDYQTDGLDATNTALSIIYCGLNICSKVAAIPERATKKQYPRGHSKYPEDEKVSWHVSALFSSIYIQGKLVSK